MEPSTYGGPLNSAPSPSTIILPIESVSLPSSNTIDYETHSLTSRRHHHQKKRHNNVTSINSQDERIEVKILPQDDNWGETTTITCNGGNDDTLIRNNDTNIQINDPIQYSSNKINHRARSILIYHFIIYLLCLIAFLSPVLFLTLPYLLTNFDPISIDDHTLLLTIVFKFLFLLFGTLLLLYRRRNTIYVPRIHVQKMFFTIILTIIIVTYWLYYIFKLIQPNIEKYEKILTMTSTYEDILLFLLLLTGFVLEIKWLYPKWIVKVVRSPDGQTRQYTIGNY